MHHPAEKTTHPKKIRGRPGSPHSKKRAPPPAQHQRESSAAPPQSTAAFHFGRKTIREMTDPAPQGLNAPPCGKTTNPKIQGRPGSPHSKKPAPPPAPHQRKSSAAPPQSTAVFHFGRKAIREMTARGPAGLNCTTLRKKHDTPKKYRAGQVHPTARSLLHPRPNINANRQRPHPKVLPCSILEPAVPQPDRPTRPCRPKCTALRKKQHTPKKYREGQVHPTARSLLHPRRHINANRQRPHPKVLPCSILEPAVPQPDRLTHEVRSRLIQVSYLGTTLNSRAAKAAKSDAL